MKVTIPKNNLPERYYVLDVILNEFLGLKYEVKELEDTLNWTIELDNGNRIVFQDAFFSDKDGLSYLSISNVPKEVNYTTNPFTFENDIPIIYGDSDIEINDKSVYCGVDIFASSFFMLTRWEEYVEKARDKHNRFSAKESLAFKNNFLHRPVVNEYTEMLWSILKHLKYEKERICRSYEFMVTHDVDMVQKFPNMFSGIKEVIADVLKRQQYKLAFSKLMLKVKVLFRKKRDPYDTFDWIMGLSEKIGVKSYFFFMGKGETKFDNHYKIEDKFVTELIGKIKKRGHFIGMHPTYNAYNNYNQFKKEKEELEANLGAVVEFGREHYLRFEVPTTWQIWEDNNMKWDSTLSFADKEGFRCGVCYEYSTYNILTRKKLNLKERPLIVMEGSFVSYQQHITSLDMEKRIKKLIDTVRKYNGTFVFLWHNSSFTNELEEYKRIYKKIIQCHLNL